MGRDGLMVGEAGAVGTIGLLDTLSAVSPTSVAASTAWFIAIGHRDLR
jgi:hypothetical protein